MWKSKLSLSDIDGPLFKEPVFLCKLCSYSQSGKTLPKNQFQMQKMDKIKNKKKTCHTPRIYPRVCMLSDVSGFWPSDK